MIITTTIGAPNRLHCKHHFVKFNYQIKTERALNYFRISLLLTILAFLLSPTTFYTTCTIDICFDNTFHILLTFLVLHDHNEFHFKKIEICLQRGLSFSITASKIYASYTKREKNFAVAQSGPILSGTFSKQLFFLLGLLRLC